MIRRLEEAIDHIRRLPEDHQVRAADALIAFASERSTCDIAD